MATSLKLQKEIEADIHEQLYANIFILTLKYPTSKEFNALFKKDMFIKNNKAAYLHVVHFLLNILDPTYFKQRNIWPTLDAKMETLFRNELMKYLNDLNSTNKETGIPLLMASHLISPGGYRFAEFIFRLSQFVLSEHVKRGLRNEVIPFPVKANNNYVIASEQIKNMEKIVDNQFSNLIQKHKAFKSKLNTANENILRIQSQRPAIQQKTNEVEEKIEAFLEINGREITNVFQTFKQRNALIYGNLMQLEIDSQSFKKCSTLFDILNENKNTVNCPVEINQNPLRMKHVDLITYYQSFLESLRNNKYMIKNRKDLNLPEYLTISSEILHDLNEHNDKYEQLVTELELYISHLEEYNSNEANNMLHMNDSLSHKIRKLFKPISSVNFPILME